MSLAVMVAACVRVPPPPVPVGAYEPVSAETFAALADRTVPRVPQLIRFRWRYDDGDQVVRGQGAARLEPPDSLRLDVAVPVVGRATLVLAGDSSWSQPEQAVAEVPESRDVLWALFGIVRRPENGTRVERGAASDRTLYRLTAPAGGVTLLECRGDTLLGASQLRGDRLLGRLVLTRDASGALVKVDATDLEHGVRFAVEVQHRETSEPFPAEIWRRP